MVADALGDCRRSECARRDHWGMAVRARSKVMTGLERRPTLPAPDRHRLVDLTGQLMNGVGDRRVLFQERLDDLRVVLGVLSQFRGDLFSPAVGDQQHEALEPGQGRQQQVEQNPGVGIEVMTGSTQMAVENHPEADEEAHADERRPRRQSGLHMIGSALSPGQLVAGLHARMSTPQLVMKGVSGQGISFH
jgi:hypothetical protein